MSVFLIATSLVTTLLIPPAEVSAKAARRTAARWRTWVTNISGTLRLALRRQHHLILAFAGASAMAGLLNLIPRYLPRFGMAPEWARASRPLVLVFMAVAFAVTILFRADVDAQGGAYATGVLVLMTSAAFAVTISVCGTSAALAVSADFLVFIYTTVLNIYERPEGIKIASFFIGAMIVTSLISRALRSTELRICDVELDDAAAALLAEDEDQVIRFIARRPRVETEEALERSTARSASRTASARRAALFFEIERGDASEFEDTLRVTGERLGRHVVLRAHSPVVANSIAALLIHLEKTTGQASARLFQMDRRESHRQSAALSDSGRRRRRAGRP